MRNRERTILTGTLRTSVGPRPATNPRQPDSRRVAAIVARMEVYGVGVAGVEVAFGAGVDGGEVGVEADSQRWRLGGGGAGGTDWILVLTTSTGKLHCGATIIRVVLGKKEEGERRDVRASPSDDPGESSRDQDPRRTRPLLLLPIFAHPFSNPKHLSINLLLQVLLVVPPTCAPTVPVPENRGKEPQGPAADDVLVHEEVRSVPDVAQDGGGPAAVQGGERERAEERPG